MPLIENWKIEIILPVLDETVQKLPLDIEGACAACPTLNELLVLLKSADPIGREGNYTGVFSLENGTGGFVPDHGANPASGRIGQTESGLCYVFKTHAAGDVDSATIETFVEKAAALHPWEHPTISVTRPLLWQPG